MIDSQKQENNNIYTFGFKSKFAERMCNHPWLTMLFYYFFSVVIIVCIALMERYSNIGKLIWMLKKGLLACIGTIILIRYFHRNTCYKVVIDNNKNIIRFYLMFDQGMVEAKSNDVKVVLDRNFNCVVNGRRFVLMNNLLHDVVALLPESTEIQFIGFFGRQWGKDLNRRNIQLRPGKGRV
jgi:hypothetical protein